MPLTPHDYDITVPLSKWQELKIAMQTIHTKRKYRDYGQEDRRFIERLVSKGINIDQIWDIGASNGAWALMVCSKLQNINVTMFEPLVPFDASYNELLRYQLKKNTNWEIHSCAVGKDDGEANIFKATDAYGSSMIESEYARVEWQSIMVPVRSIDSLIENDGLTPPDIIKADVQGFEMQVLQGSIKNLGNVKALLLESWISRGYGPETPLLHEMESWLKAHGFVLAEINECYRDESGQMQSVDAFFVAKSLASELGIHL